MHISTFATKGGAAKAAYRLHKSIQKQGVESKFLVLHQSNSDDSIVAPYASNPLRRVLVWLSWYVDQIPVRLYWRRQRTIQFTGLLNWFQLHNNPVVREADVLVLHWVSGGFLGIKTLSSLFKLGKPVVWRMSDMAPFTGGCHYSSSCGEYQLRCGSCPNLGSHTEYDISMLSMKMKKKLWVNNSVTLVSPSVWLADQARKSNLFDAKKICIIRTGVNVDIFYNHDKKRAREKLGLPFDKILILFGAINPLGDPRKGGDIAIKIFKELFKRNGDQDEYGLVIFGSSSAIEETFSQTDIYCMNEIDSETELASLYSACDVFIAPSREENLANTVLESMACGTPCVAFDVGGMPDVIKHQKNGYLVEPFNEVEFASGIKWVTGNASRLKELSVAAKHLIHDHFNLSTQSKRYIELFGKLIENKHF